MIATVVVATVEVVVAVAHKRWTELYKRIWSGTKGVILQSKDIYVCAKWGRLTRKYTAFPKSIINFVFSKLNFMSGSETVFSFFLSLSFSLLLAFFYENHISLWIRTRIYGAFRLSHHRPIFNSFHSNCASLIPIPSHIDFCVLNSSYGGKLSN